VDSSVYRPLFIDQTAGTYARDPQVATQWDGSNTIVHLSWVKTPLTDELAGDGYVSDGGGTVYWTWNYFRKVGSTPAPAPGAPGRSSTPSVPRLDRAGGRAIPRHRCGGGVHHPTYWGCLLENGTDVDIWCRESFDAASPGRRRTASPTIPTRSPATRTTSRPARTGCMFDSEGDLHVTGSPARPRPTRTSTASTGRT